MAKWLVTGGSGLLGHHICHYLSARGDAVTATHHQHPLELSSVKPYQLNLLDFGALDHVIQIERPDYIFHTAALANVDKCENDPELAKQYNIDLPAAVAKSACAVDAKMIHVTTDQLWTGDKAVVNEEEPTSPVNVYGATKAESEKQVLNIMPEALILRTNFFGKGRPWRKSFSDWLYDELSNGKSINGFDDIFYSPIAIDHFVPNAITLVEKNASGIFHLAGAQRISKYDFIAQFIDMLSLDKDLLKKCKCDDANLSARRPKDMSLSVAKIESYLGHSMPTVKDSIQTLI